MIKYLFVIGVILGIYYFFIKKKPTIHSNTQNKHKKEASNTNDMLECATCGIYCEIDDTIISHNKYYCSNECVTQ
ncbi:MAG: hypothetical protein L3I99_08685 [Sulfurimonas sp.]|nr:hypothetical protein [Sulfurimonas sp.]